MQSMPALLLQSSLGLGLGLQENICSIELAHLLHCSDDRGLLNWQELF